MLECLYILVHFLCAGPILEIKGCIWRDQKGHFVKAAADSNALPQAAHGAAGGVWQGAVSPPQWGSWGRSAQEIFWFLHHLNAWKWHIWGPPGTKLHATMVDIHLHKIIAFRHPRDYLSFVTQKLMILKLMTRSFLIIFNFIIKVDKNEKNILTGDKFRHADIDWHTTQ